MAIIALIPICSALLAAQDCPLHAQPLRQLERLDGACATAWIPDALRRALGIALDGEVLLVASGESNAVFAWSQGNAATRVESIGALKWPVAMASDEEALLIAERGAGSIAIFHGEARLTLGEGVLRTPCAIAVDGTLVAVADDGLGAVVVFDLSAKDNAVIARHEGTRPSGVAFDGLGNLWWSDAAQHTLHQVADHGRAASRQIGERGSFPDQYTEPRALAARGECLFVADHLNHRIAILSARSGAFLGYWGMHAVVPRQGDGRIHYPDSISLNGSGTVAAIAEGFEDRVQLFTTGGAAPVDDGLGSGKGAVSSHFGSEVAGAGGLLAMHEPETGAIILFDANNSPPYNIATVGASGASPGRYPSVSALAVTTDGSRFVVADESRSVLDIWSCAIDRTKPLFWDAFGAKLVRSLDLTQVREAVDGVALSRTPRIVDLECGVNVIFALDAVNRAVLVFDLDFRLLQICPLPHEARDVVEFCHVGDGLVVADPGLGCLWIRESNTDWRQVTALKGSSTAVALVRPMGVGSTTARELVVSDAARDCLYVCAPSTSVRVCTDFERTIGTRGELDEEFWLPLSIAPLGDGFTVVDRGNHRFQIFDRDGRWSLTTSLSRFYTRKRTPATDTTGNES